MNNTARLDGREVVEPRQLSDARPDSITATTYNGCWHECKSRGSIYNLTQLLQYLNDGAYTMIVNQALRETYISATKTTHSWIACTQIWRDADGNEVLIEFRPKKSKKGI